MSKKDVQRARSSSRCDKGILLARAHPSPVYLQHTLDHLVVYVRRDVVTDLFPGG
jgi:hypothetical protein